VASINSAIILQLHLFQEGQEIFGARLEAAELDDLIRGLADARAQLADSTFPGHSPARRQSGIRQSVP
jgi:hypothetical protein